MDFHPLLITKRLVAALVLPPIGPLLLVLFGALLARRWPRLGRRAFWLGLLASLAFAMPFVAGLLARSLEEAAPLDVAAAKRAQAIVVLAGNADQDAPEYGGDTVGAQTLQRVRYAARLARQTGLPLLVSGGSPEGGHPLALAMRDALERDFGMSVRWTESASVDTRENALYSRDVLRRDKISRIVLVTHAIHMRRAARHFADAGFEVLAAPTAYARDASSSWQAYLPGAAAQQLSSAALHEWLGIAAIELGLDAVR